MQGILALVAGIAVFSVQDLILKQLSGNYPLHQAMASRLGGKQGRAATLLVVLGLVLIVGGQNAP